MQEFVLVTEKSCAIASKICEWHKIDKDNHFEVCRPNSKNHAGYKILLEHLHQHLNVLSSTHDSDVTPMLEKRQSDDVSKASEAFPAENLSYRTESSSGSAIFSATPEHSTLPNIDSDTPSHRSRYILSFFFSDTYHTPGCSCSSEDTVASRHMQSIARCKFKIICVLI